MRHYLLVVAIAALASSPALAGSNAPTPGAVALVNEQLVKPLAAKEREQSKFSRARLPAAERRVRVLDDKAQQDGAGNAFFAFAIDARHGWSDDDGAWTKSAITGCAYVGSGEVFIKRGNAFHPAKAALGKKTKAAPEYTCHASAQLSAR